MRIGLVLGVLALLASLWAVIPAFATVQGDGDILDSGGGDSIAWSMPGVTIFLQVTDADDNVANSVTAEELSYSVAGACSGEGEFKVVQVAPGNVPILDKAGGSGVNFEDVTINVDSGNSATTVFAVDAVNGVITLKCEGASPGVTSQRVNYDAAGTDTLGTAESPFSSSVVRVTSQADEVGIGVELSEIDPDDGTPAVDTGVFGISLFLCSTGGCSATTSPPRLQVATETNDRVTLTYDDPDEGKDITTVAVESRRPDFSNLFPVQDFATRVSRPDFGANVTDGDSGIAVDDDGNPIDVEWIFLLTSTSGGALGASDGVTTDNPAVVDANEGGVTSITGGFSIADDLPSTSVLSVPTLDVYLIQWWVVAVDTAGVAGVTDQDPDTVCDPSSFNKREPLLNLSLHRCDPRVVRVDDEAPSIVDIFTGNSFDDDEEVLDAGTDASNTSIQVLFDEPLNGASAVMSAFSSTDVDINSVSWFDVDNVDGPDIDTVADADGLPGCIRCSVFLNVDAMASNLEPELDVSGIEDAATNDMVAVVDEMADDGLPAGLTVTVTGVAASLTDEQITIEVVSDEAMSGSPNVFVFRLDDHTETFGGNLALGEVNLSGTRRWEAEFDISNPGLYNVFVSATDLGAGILGEIGMDGDMPGETIDIDDGAAILFEVDTGIPEPSWPLTVSNTDDPNTFISADFSDEGREYGLDESGDRTEDPSEIAGGGTNFDTHGTLTLAVATFDDVDITADVSTSDNIVFLYKASSLSLGTHTITIEVDDEAGNTVEFSHDFDVEERVPFELSLIPGWNLVSLPGAPASADINDVISSDVPVTVVWSYDLTVPGGWLVAVRVTSDDPWVGDLTTIDSNRGYWMLTSTFQPLNIDIPVLPGGGLAGATPVQPPLIKLFEGWNLVPILDVTGGLSAGEEIDADVYLGGAADDIASILTFDTITGLFRSVATNGALTTGGGVTVGSAYWMFATSDITLVPGTEGTE